jgi:hypothetical protein
MPTLSTGTMINQEPYTVPSHWLCALVNDDYSGIADNEEAIIRQFIADLGDRYLFTVPNDGESFFTRCHDARDYGVLACDCVEIQVAFEAESEPDYDADDAICNRYSSMVLDMFVG